MIDAFYIGAYWKNRKAALDKIVESTVKTYQKLGGIDEQYSGLYELGWSRKKALENHIIVDLPHIKSLYQKEIKKGDVDESGYNDLGFRLSAWTGHKNDEASNISICAGSANPRITNSCIIKVPAEGDARNRLLKIEKAKDIIALLVEIWNPDQVILNSREIRNMFEQEKGENVFDSHNIIGWVTYVPHLNGSLPTDWNIVHDSDFHGGHLFYLKTNDNSVYDYDSMQDLLPLIDFV